MSKRTIRPESRLCEAAKQIEIAAEVLKSNEVHPRLDLLAQAAELRRLAATLRQ